MSSFINNLAQSWSLGLSYPLLCRFSRSSKAIESIVASPASPNPTLSRSTNSALSMQSSYPAWQSHLALNCFGLNLPAPFSSACAHLRNRPYVRQPSPELSGSLPCTCMHSTNYASGVWTPRETSEKRIAGWSLHMSSPSPAGSSSWWHWFYSSLLLLSYFFSIGSDKSWRRFCAGQISSMHISITKWTSTLLKS